MEKYDIEKLIASQVSTTLMKVEAHLKSIPANEYKELRNKKMYLNYNMLGQLTSASEKPHNFISIDTTQIQKKSEDIGYIVDGITQDLYYQIITGFNNGTLTIPENWITE